MQENLNNTSTKTVRRRIICKQKQYKEQFSKEENFQLIELIEKYGTKWTKIQKFMPKRTIVMIRNQFHTYLKKKFFKENPSLAYKYPKTLQMIINSSTGLSELDINFHENLLNDYYKKKNLNPDEQKNNETTSDAAAPAELQNKENKNIIETSRKFSTENSYEKETSYKTINQNQYSKQCQEINLNAQSNYEELNELNNKLSQVIKLDFTQNNNTQQNQQATQTNNNNSQQLNQFELLQQTNLFQQEVYNQLLLQQNALNTFGCLTQIYQQQQQQAKILEQANPQLPLQLLLSKCFNQNLQNQF